jgi:hypothetical protein
MEIGSLFFVAGCAKVGDKLWLTGVLGWGIKNMWWEKVDKCGDNP